MGDVLNRGSKDRPLWYCRFVDVDGRWKQRHSKQPSKALAMRYLAEVEARVAAGKVGIPEASDEERMSGEWFRPSLRLLSYVEEMKRREADLPDEDEALRRAVARLDFTRKEG